MSYQKAYSIPHFIVIYSFVLVPRMLNIGLIIKVLMIPARELRTLTDNLTGKGKTLTQ